MSETVISAKALPEILSKLIKTEKVKIYEVDGNINIEPIKEDARVINSSVDALKKFQDAMEGEAEKAGIMSEDDIMELCAEVRKELYKKKICG